MLLPSFTARGVRGARTFSCVSTAALVSLIPAIARAQATRAERAVADSAARARALNPVVTTATRDSRELRKLPVSVSVVDTTTLARTSQVSLTEALRTVPGVIAGNLFGGDDVRLSIRGSGARARRDTVGRGTGTHLRG